MRQKCTLNALTLLSLHHYSLLHNVALCCSVVGHWLIGKLWLFIIYDFRTELSWVALAVFPLVR